MCKIDSEIFDTQSPAPLFDGKQQHWVLAFPDSGLSDEMRVMFFRNRYLSDLGISLDDIVITGRRIGNPSAIQGRLRKRIANHIDIKPEDWLPSDTVYVSIAFDLEGAPKSIPWPWDYDGCPDELTSAGGLYSVFAPAQIVHIPETDVLGDTIDDITKDIEETTDDISTKLPDLPGPTTIGLGIAGGLALWLLLRK